MQAFFIALQFLTRIPITFKTDWNDKNIANSVLWYPLVGALMGGLLVLLANVLLTHTDEMLSAAIILAVWVMFSGGLHLDGLADSADAWVGSHGDKQRALDIMKDPQAGPIAVIVLLLTLLVKFTALHSLLKLDESWLIFLALVVGRCVPLVLFTSTPYVREQGLGSVMAKNIPHKPAWFVLLVVSIFVMIILGFVNGAILVGISLSVLWWLRYLMLKQIEGMTGDTMGAAIEIIEVFVLCYLVFILSV